MGYQDREYYRDQKARRGFLDASDEISTTAKIVGFTVAIFLADMLLGKFRLMDHMALNATDLTSPRSWWHFLSYAFAHNARDFRHILFNMLALFMLGRDVEYSLRSKQEYIKFYCCAAIFSGLVWALLHQGLLAGNSVIGASGAVAAVVVLFVWLEPQRKMLFWFIELPAWAVGILFVSMDAFGSAQPLEQNQIAYDAHLAGAAFATLYFLSGKKLLRFIPDWPALGGLSAIWRSLRRRVQPRPKLKTYVPEPELTDLESEADRILEKLHREGESSLTPKEREALEAYSQRVRDKNRSL